MKNIVIAGAGPIGLYTAIRLRKMGVKNITIVDPRAGNYTRDGILDVSVFEKLGQQLGLSSALKHSSSHHIKDVERSLLDLAESHGIKIMRARAETFVGKKMKIVNTETKEEELLPCDLALDGTGPQRALIKEVNRLAGRAVYEIKPVDNNPLPNHFIAYVHMTPEDTALLTKTLERSRDPVVRTAALEKLRTEFGWPEFAAPSFNFQALGKNKVCLYFETPPDLPAEKQDAWLKALLQFKTGKEDITFEKTKPSRKYAKKPRYLPFTVTPHKATSTTYQADRDTPIVIPIGDAQIEPDYRLGLGIISGVMRVNALLDSMTVRKGEIVALRVDQYNALVAPHLQRHEGELIALYSDRRDKIRRALVEEFKNYTEALATTDDPTLKLQIPKALAEISYRLAMNAWAEAKKTFANTLKSGSIELDRYGNIVGEIALARAHQLFQDAYKQLPSSREMEKSAIKADLLQLAKSYKDLGSNLYRKGKLTESEKFYKLSLELFKEYFPEEHQDEVVKLYSNLVTIQNQKKNYTAAIQTADIALDLLPDAKMEEKDKFIGKITYHKLSAMAERLNARPDEEIDVEKAAAELEQISAATELLKKNRFVAASDLEKLGQKLVLCKEKITSLSKENKENEKVSRDAPPKNDPAFQTRGGAARRIR